MLDRIQDEESRKVTEGLSKLSLSSDYKKDREAIGDPFPAMDFATYRCDGQNLVYVREVGM